MKTHIHRFVFLSLTAFVFMIGCTKQATEEFTVPVLKPRAAGMSQEEFTKAQASYDKMLAEYKKDTNNFHPLVKIAQILIIEARITGDHHYYYPSALKVLDHVLMSHGGDYEALVSKGSILMSYHKFAEALDIAKKAEVVGQGNAYTFGLLTDANVELGNYEEALKNADQMASIRPDLRSYSRISYMREIHGDRDGAKQAMKMAGDAGSFGQEDRVWAFKELGNLYLGEGALDTAEFIFKGILEERPSYAFGMAGMAQVQVAKKDYQPAVLNLVKASQISPEHIFIEQLADIYLVMGDTASAKTMEEKAMLSFAQHEKDGWMVDREMAVFMLNHNMKIDEALNRAKREYDRRSKNIDAADTYAWALYKNNKAQEAVHIMEQALRLKMDNTNMYYHAGMIYAAAGDKANGMLYLEKALKRNPYLTPLTLEEAKKTLASLKGTA